MNDQLVFPPVHGLLRFRLGGWGLPERHAPLRRCADQLVRRHRDSDVPLRSCPAGSTRELRTDKATFPIGSEIGCKPPCPVSGLDTLSRKR